MSVKAYVALKRLDFRRWIWVEQLGGGFGILVAVVLSIWLRSVWALVIGFLVEGLARTVLSFVVFPYLPLWRFDQRLWRQLVQYSKRMAGVPILAFLFMNTDVFVVGKLASAKALGLYAMAVTLARVPDLVMSKIFAPVMITGYAQMQQDRTAINTSYLRLMGTLGVIAAPFVVVALLYGDGMMAVLYTEEYRSVGIVFGILACASVVRNLCVPFASICIATGNVHSLRWTSAVRLGLLFAAIFPATKYLGLVGAAVSVLASASVAFMVQLTVLSTLTRVRLAHVMGRLGRGFVMAAPALVLAPIGWFWELDTSRRLALAAISVCFCYAFYGWSVWRKRRRESGLRTN